MGILIVLIADVYALSWVCAKALWVKTVQIKIMVVVILFISFFIITHTLYVAQDDTAKRRLSSGRLLVNRFLGILPKTSRKDAGDAEGE